ncbi:MAG: methionine--tRNA ligase [Phycisphaerales bacterium]
MPSADPYYVTTPIYYVNDRPHIGHCYTTLLADVAARAQRLIGGPDRPVFFLTGTDEHAEKVSKSAAEHGVTPMEWATTNAERFKDAFAFMNFSNDDFVRTTEDRHTTRATAYIQKLLDQGDIELGDYSGWYDPSQEEYVTETTAKEHDFKSPVTGKPLEQRTEQNYFFDLPRHAAWLQGEIESGAIRVLPEARKNEVLGRLKQGLQRVPVSRRIKEGDPDWGITMPGDPEHRIYVWIEALCNYLTVVDEPDRRQFWPPSPLGGEGRGEGPDSSLSPPGRGRGEGSSIVHMMAKDILWFHAVIWPCMLRALGETPPETVYAHAYWIAEGKKMSKSLGNFIEIDQLRAYAQRYHLDAVRWYLATQGPAGANDADFAHARFVEVYNADLANSFGNATSRVANMIEKYLGGVCERQCNGEFGLPGGKALPIAIEARAAAGKPVDDPERTFNFAQRARDLTAQYRTHADDLDLESMLRCGLTLAREVDDFISYTAPFTLAKRLDDHEHADKALATILYTCAEALRIASLMLYPAMPEKMADLWRLWNCDHLNDPADANSGFRAPLAELAAWTGAHSIKVGQQIAKGDALFMRADPKEDAPGA